MSSTVTSRTTVVFHPAFGSGRTRTWGMSRQILANSAMAGEADGTLSAVGRKPAISS
ncbi:hypothetical protein [Streptomyces sp. NPDC060322]|uniref:hypothetical protein n=1 Tax=Streptomyces sp. NPDC060322 TaxID=3347097 RepID=UPI00366486FF